MTTDTSEKGLETILVEGLCERGWTQGNPVDFIPKFGLDLEQLRSFIRATQPAIEIELDLSNDTATRNKSLDRILREITSRGIIDVLRTGVKHGPHHIDLFFGAPSPGNAKAKENYDANRFTAEPAGRPPNRSAVSTAIFRDRSEPSQLASTGVSIPVATM